MAAPMLTPNGAFIIPGGDPPVKLKVGMRVRFLEGGTGLDPCTGTIVKEEVNDEFLVALDQANTGHSHHLAAGFGLPQGTGFWWAASHCLVPLEPPGPAPAPVKKADYPHVCAVCGDPCYRGFTAVDCSRAGCPGR